MKKKYLSIILLFSIAFSACDFLDKTPVDSYSDATVWTNVNLASMYLNYCYYEVGFSWGYVHMTNFTDESPYGRGAATTFLTDGGLTPDVSNKLPYCYQWARFKTIQRVNIFLDKIDAVLDSYDTEKESVKEQIDILKGEAYYLRAFLYCNLARTYGGLPLMSEPNKLGDDYTLIARSTWEETVDFIVDDCNSAAELLPIKADQEMGRANKEAALALKSRILLFAASDLTAGDVSSLTNDASGGIGFDNALVHYQNPDRTALWKAARDAALDVINLPGTTCALAEFGGNTGAAIDEIRKNYQSLFYETTAESSEYIMAYQVDALLGRRNTTNRTDGPNGYHGFGRNAPFELFIEKYYRMEDGSPFLNHFYIDPVEENGETVYYVKNRPEITGYDDDNPYYHREARFYANVLHDSALFSYIYPRPISLQTRDPLGIYDRRTRIVIAPDGKETISYGLDSRNGPITPGNGTYTGYISLKYMQPGVDLDGSYSTNVWPQLRFTEVVLNYAEACCELGEYDNARTYLNKIRTRVGLPEFTGSDTELLEEVKHERAIEGFDEDWRWFDLRRWLELKKAMPGPTWGIDITQITDQRSPYSVENPNITTTWKYAHVMPEHIILDKTYWLPISTTERQKAPYLVQNPGYSTALE